MKKSTIGILTLITAAGAGIFAVAQSALTPTVSPPAIENGPSPTVSGAPGQCSYSWAYESLPEITTEFQAAVQILIPEAEARASAFGENCVREDGSSTFGAMETDFYVTISVADLHNNDALGNLVEQILSVTDGFDHSRIPGPKDGFVEVIFQSGTERRIVRVPIPLGKQLREQGLRGAELFKAVENP